MSLDARLGFARLGLIALGRGAASGTIQPTSISSEEAFGIPSIFQAGTIYPDSILSAEAFGVPSFAQIITIGPSSIASAEAFGTPSISFPVLSQTVSPSSIASAEAFGSISIKGPPQTIICASIPNAEAFGFATLTNVGAPYQEPQIFFNGVEFPYLRRGTMNTAAQIQQRSQASVDLIWYANTFPDYPAVGQHCLITENYRREFAGFVTAVKAQIVPGNALLQFNATITDLGGIADRRKVMASYPAGDAATIVRTILANELNDEGLTANHVLVAANTVKTVGGGQSFKQVLDSISNDTGGLWYIDYFADIHVELPGQGGAAPFNITATNSNIRNFSVNTNLNTFANTVSSRSDQTLQ